LQFEHYLQAEWDEYSTYWSDFILKKR